MLCLLELICKRMLEKRTQSTPDADHALPSSDEPMLRALA
jgi:hypothetical protein